MTTPPSRTKLHRGLLLGGAGAGLALLAGLGSAVWLRANGLTVVELASELRRDGPRFEWRSLDGKHWQAIAPGSGGGEPPDVTEAREQTGAGCPIGMVRVRGDYRLESLGDATGEIERLQDAACTDWIRRDFPARCRSFDRARIAAEIAKLPTRAMDYCIDRFEYPNLAGQNPVVVVTHREAESLCGAAHKRLCTESEWTFACEGEEVRPYPYGFERDTTACVMDRAWRPFKEGALQPRGGTTAREELDRLWQGEPSGSRAGCKSPFGVYDMTGNVDEWTRSVRATGYASVLKGGYWGPIRARCRPATRAHDEEFVAYQQGFRCCAESDGAVAPPRAASGPARAPDAARTVAPVALPPRPAADRIPSGQESVWPAYEAEDEMDALSRARPRLGCAVASPGEGETGGAGAAVVGGLLALSRRRRATVAPRSSGR